MHCCELETGSPRSNHKECIKGHSLAEDPTLLGCQSRAAPTPRQVAHLDPNST